MQRATLCFLIRRGRVLLIRKKRGIGAGKYNGPGGRIEKGETPAEGAAREVAEEVGISVSPEDLSFCGKCIFYFGRTHFMDVYVFCAKKFSGRARETPEALPEWFSLSSVPFSEMWADDKFWFPHMLSGEIFEGTFWFDKKNEKLLRHKLRVSRWVSEGQSGSRGRA